MSQHPIEVILAQRLASYLAMPVMLVGSDGELLYYNEWAESLIGFRFDETGTVPLDLWASVLQPTEEDGTQIPVEDMPIVRALRKREPVHQALRIQGLDGVVRKVEGTAFPLEGQGNRHLGALTIFWLRGDE